MTYLLDTHIIVWALTDTKRLSANVRVVLENPRNRLLVSTVSFWEVSTKFALNKLELVALLPEDLPAACEAMGLEITTMSAEAASTYHQLPAQYHKDPFDRMLIWQAMIGGYTLLSSDSAVHKYASGSFKVVW